MYTRDEIFQRSRLLLGKSRMQRIQETRIILFGVGGVGSWCAESLVRSGVEHLTIVDSDEVNISNINRQLMATTQTVGQPKVDVLKERLLAINPSANINAIRRIYDGELSESFDLDSYDYIIDAIDSLENKAHLLVSACRTHATVFSSMGAALKKDPTKIQVAEFWKVRGCPLAAALRRKLKKNERPAKKFQCVFSEEVLENRGAEEEALNANQPKSHWDSKKAQINGTLSHITAIFGFTLAGLVINHICEQDN